MCDHCMKHGSGGKWYLNASRLLGGGRPQVQPARVSPGAVQELRADLRPQGGRHQPSGNGPGLSHAHHRQAGEAFRGEAPAQHAAAAQSVPPRGTHRAGGAPGGWRCNTAEVRGRADHREELHVPLHDARLQGILLHQFRRDVGDHRQAAAIHPGKGQVPPHPGGGRAAVHRAQPEGIHRHDLVRPLSRTSTTSARASPPNARASAPAWTSGSCPSTRRSTWRACTTVSAAAAGSALPAAPSRPSRGPRHRLCPGGCQPPAMAAASAATSATRARCSSFPVTRLPGCKGKY